jgi:hypothetical protein
MVESGDAAPVQRAVSDSHYFSLLRELEQIDAIWWERTTHAYVLSSAIRRLINCRCWLEDSGQLCQILNQRALAMYWQRATADPAACGEAIQEVLYHLAVLSGNQPQKEQWWEQALVALTFARDHLPPAQLRVLNERLAEDCELASLLSPHLYDGLLRQSRFQPLQPPSPRPVTFPVLDVPPLDAAPRQAAAMLDATTPDAGPLNVGLFPPRSEWHA